MSTACGGAESAESAESGERANSRSCALSRLAEAQPRRSRGAAEVQPRCVKLTSALAPPCGARGRPRAGRPGKPQCRTWARPGRRSGLCAGSARQATPRRSASSTSRGDLAQARSISANLAPCRPRGPDLGGERDELVGVGVASACPREGGGAVRACACACVRPVPAPAPVPVWGLCAVWRGGCVRRGMAAVWHPRRWSGQSVPPSGGAAPRPRRRR